MNDENCAGKENDSDIFTNNRKRDFVSLYGNNRKQINKFNTKTNARNVLFNVFSQIKVIQNAERNAYRIFRKNVPNSLKKSSFVPVTDLTAKYEDEMPVSPRLETSCIIDNKQSLIEYAGHSQMLAGLTEEFNTTFNQDDNESILDCPKNQHTKIPDDSHLGSLQNEDTFNGNINENKTHKYIKHDKVKVTSSKENILEINKIISCDSSSDSDLFEIDSKNYYFCDETSKNETEINMIREAQFSGIQGTDNNSGGSSNKTIMLNESIEMESNNSPIIIDQPKSPVVVTKRTQNILFAYDLGESLVFDLDQFERFERKAQSMLKNTDVNKITAPRNSQEIDQVLENSQHSFNVVKDKNSNYEKDEGRVKKGFNEKINLSEDDFSITAPSNDRIRNPIIEFKDNNVNKESTVQESSQSSFSGIFKEEFPLCIKNNDNINKENKDEDYLSTVPSYDRIQSPIIEMKDKTIVCSRKGSLFNFKNNEGQVELDCKEPIADDEFHDDRKICIDSLMDEIVISSDDEIYYKEIQKIDKACAPSFEDTEIFFPGLDEEIEEADIKDEGFTDDKNTFNISLEKSECEIFLSRNSDSAVILKNEYDANKFDTSTNASRMDMSDEAENFPHTVTEGFMGFKTANNKEITISKEALAKTKNIFKDIEKDSQLQSNTASNAKTAYINDIENNDKLMVTNCFTGFKTASNKEITISKEALAKTKSIFEDIEKDSHLHTEYLKEIKHCDKKQKLVHNTNTGFMNNTENRNRLLGKNSFLGFKTANNKEITISKEALAKTKNIFDDIEKDSQLNMEYLKENNLCDKKRELVHNTNTRFMNNTENKNSFMGFKTANNKEITISKEAFAKTKNIFDDIEKDSQLHMEYLKENNLCDKKQDRVHNTESTNDSSLSRNLFMGFKTAHNKEITITKEALAKTKNIFKDIVKDSPLNTICQKESFVENMEHSSAKSTTTDVKESRKLNINCFVGFKTANNKEIAISKEALAKTKNVFENIDKDCLLPAKRYHENETERHLNTSESNPIDVPKDLKFYGFKSASNKDIHISAKALEKTRDIFKDIDVGRPKQSPEISEGAFQTANNNKISVTKTALARTRKIFEVIDKCKENKVYVDLVKEPLKSFKSGKNDESSQKSLSHARDIFKDIESNDEKALGSFKRANDNLKVLSNETKFFSPTTPQTLNKNIDVREITGFENAETKYFDSRYEEMIMDNFIDTQIRSEFEKSISTEDFSSPKAKKRSASPILLCQSEKRFKRFQVPHKSSLKTIDETKDVHMERFNRFYTFDENYKKRKKYSMKDLKRMEAESETKPDFDPHILKFNFDDELLDFEFDASRNSITNEKLVVKDLKEIFLESVKRDIVPEGWIENHLKLILWKLISYEKDYPKTLKFVCEASNVIEQLKYRYDKELYKVERPALRKILEKDDVSTKTLILRVLVIYQDDIVVDSVKSASNIELLVTDGWYTIKASIDKTLSKLVFDGKIKIGTKLVTNGAELVNCDQGMTPWEDTSQVRLRLHGNSTRRARFDARLGFTGHSAILSRLSNVTLDGGKVSKLRLYVTRVYPTLYVEKLENGSTVTRSERMEYVHQTKYDAERQSILEKKYEEVERELSDEDSQDSEGKVSKRTCLETGSQIELAMKRSIDPIEFQERLTESQSHLLTDYLNKKRERKRRAIEERVRQRLGESLLQRNVVSLVKVRVADVNDEGVATGVLSLWKPNESTLEIIKEGTWIEVLNVVPTAFRHNEIQISAGRQSVLRKCKRENEPGNPQTSLDRKCYTIKQLTTNPRPKGPFNEIDTCGLIFSIDAKDEFQNVYLTDADKNMICICFWGGVKKFCFENVVQVDQIVACVNMLERFGNNRRSIPHYRVTEYTYFTLAPKNDSTRKLLDCMRKEFAGLDRRKFCKDCVAICKNYAALKSNENMSPYRFSNMDLSKNKVFIESPLVRNVNLNSIPVDLEAKLNRQPNESLSPKDLERKRKVREKMNKLKSYAEPPPMSPIPLINKSEDFRRSYVSPVMKSRDVCVASEEKSKTYKVEKINDENNAENISLINKSEDFRSYVSPVVKSSDVCVASEEKSKTCHENNPGKPLINKSENFRRSYASPVVKIKDVCVAIEEKSKTSNLEINDAKNNSAQSNNILYSPVLKRTAVNRIKVNPVKLNFSNNAIQENSTVVDINMFDEDLDGSLPLSLDSC